MTATPSDPVAVEAARLLGYDRPRRRCTDNDLAVEAEYRLHAAQAYLASGEVNEHLRAFHSASLESVRVEIERRLAVGPPRRGKGMTRQAVEAIRDAVPCQEYIQYLGLSDLKPKGRERWEGLCFLHAERTPSLSVHREFWHCFGCQVGGDVFALAQAVIGLSKPEATFRDAVRVLADYAGLPDPTIPPEREGRNAGI